MRNLSGLAIILILVIHIGSRATEVVQGNQSIPPPTADQFEEFASSCKARNQVFSGKLKSGTSVSEAVKNIARSNPRLITVGESHGGYALRQMPALLAEIKKQMPDLNCLFIEFPDGANKDLQAIKKGNLNDLDDG